MSRDSRQFKISVKEQPDVNSFKDRFQARRPTIQIDYSHYYQEPRKSLAPGSTRRISANYNNQLAVLQEKAPPTGSRVILESECKKTGKQHKFRKIER